MDDYPIPVDTTDDLGAVSSNMFEALHLMGFLGYMRMQVYSEQPNSEDWLNAEMSYAPKCKSLATTLSLLVVSVLIICNRSYFSLFDVYR